LSWLLLELKRRRLCDLWPGGRTKSLSTVIRREWILALALIALACNTL
jgi:hypothetical protein